MKHIKCKYANITQIQHHYIIAKANHIYNIVKEISAKVEKHTLHKDLRTSISNMPALICEKNSKPDKSRFLVFFVGGKFQENISLFLLVQEFWCSFFGICLGIFRTCSSIFLNIQAISGIFVRNSTKWKNHKIQKVQNKTQKQHLKKQTT